MKLRKEWAGAEDPARRPWGTLPRADCVKRKSIMELLKNKVAVITGVNSGIGRKTAELFGQNGAQVVGADIREDRMGELQAAIEAAGSAFVGCRCDVRDEAQVKAVFDRALEAFGRVDIVVNIAGISNSSPVTRISGEEFDRVMEINVKGAFNFCKCAAVIFKKQKHGVIINTSSVTAIYGSGMGCPYPASKAAVLGLSKSLASELAPWNVRVNTVAPGVINTEMVGMLSDKARQTFADAIPLRRMGEAEDVADAMLFLASDMARYITGATLCVDGGYRPDPVNP